MAKKIKKVVVREDYLAKLLKIDVSKYKYRILSIDPGKTNMGISCLGVKADDTLVVLANAVICRPFTELKAGFMQSLNTCLAEIDNWVKCYTPHCISMERYMNRKIGGDSAEVVSILIGAISYKYQMPTKLLNAAVWKNAFHSRFVDSKLEEIYKYSKTTPHAIDAILQGCYALELALQRPLNYTPDSIVAMAEATSLTKLINRQSRL